MDYKEKYEMALEGIQEILGSGEDSIKMSRLQLRLQGIFPELKESEDERMWKLIKKYAHCNVSDMALNADHITREQLESWLEKQGEKGTKGNEREIPFATWSEEDEKFVHGLIRGLAAKRNIFGHTTFSSDCIDITETINWLKSLRPQNRWKPSESDILLLERIANGKSNPQDFQASLSGLVEQLKKL